MLTARRLAGRSCNASDASLAKNFIDLSLLPLLRASDNRTPADATWFESMSMGTRTLGLCAALMCALVLMFTLRAKSVTDAADIESAYMNAENSTRVFSEQVRNVFAEVEAILKVAEYALSSDPSPDSLKSLIGAGGISMRTLVQIAFTDAAGRTLQTHVGPDQNLTDVSDREHIQVHFDPGFSGLFISKPLLGRVSGKWSIQVTRRINRPDGTRAGVLVASIDPFYFSHFWKPVHFGGALSVELFDKAGFTLAATSNLEEALASQSIRSDILKRAASGKSERFVSTDNRGVQRYSALGHVDGFPLLVISGFNKEYVDNISSDRNSYFYAFAFLFCCVVCIATVALDLTMRKLRNERSTAVASRMYLDHALEALDAGVSLYGSDGRLILVNSAYRNLFQRVSHVMKPGVRWEIVNETMATSGYFGKETFEKWEAHRQAATGREKSFVMVADLLDGRSVKLVERVTDDGGTLSIRIDVTEDCKREASIVESRNLLAMQAEELMRLAESEKRANNEKSVFVASMSHEIRTPLNAIVGFSELLFRLPLDNIQREYISIIESSAKHLKALVSDILDFSRIEAGKIDIFSGPFRIKDTMEKLVGITRSLVGDKPIEIGLQMAPSTPRELEGDGARLYQIMVNLTGNAAKFTRSGRIDIDVEDLGGPNTARRLRFVVADTGPGFDNDKVQKLFESFEQGRAGRAHGAGTGLGLAISLRLARMMGGTLEAQRREHGARFVLELPFGVLGDQEIFTDDNKASGGAAGLFRPLRILVAEDSLPSRLLVEILLRHMGHEVVAVGDGEKAVDAASKGLFDLAVLDLQMPVMDGLEAARRIRRLPAGLGARKIVALTAQAFSEDRVAAIKAGMDGFLTKPFVAQEFADLIVRLQFNAGCSGDVNAQNLHLDA